MTSPQSVPPVAPARLEGDATDHASQVADPATDARQSEALAPLAAQEPAAAVSGPLFSPKEHQPVQDGLTAADLAHRSGMVHGLGLFSRLFAWIFFKPVQFSPRLNNDLAALAREGVLVYTMNTISLLDYLYFNYALSRAALPLARFANGVSLIAFQPWRRAVATWFRRIVLQQKPKPDAEIMRGHLRRHDAILLFLRRGFTLVDLITPRQQESYLRELISAQREVDFPLIVVPQVLVWHRNPDRDRSSIIDGFFGDPEVPGRLRKLLSFILNHRRAFVQMGQPIHLQPFLAEHPGIDDDGLLAERLRFRVVQSFKTEQRIIRGSPIKAPNVMREEILQEAEVDSDLRRIAGEINKPYEIVRAEADTNLKEIAAHYQMGMVSFISFFLTLLWARIYEGIEVDEEGLERIREVGRKSPVIVVPSHKSHIDYLIISYLFYRNGLIPPHIAAGANLSFFPLGTIFRRGGAFFLRRSFHGQPIYGAIFRHYMRKLLRDGHWLEFFPEGGRSRTGKLLPPKFGLLTTVLEAVADGIVQDVALLPTNFGYERLIEETAYRKELEGGEKKGESVGEVLKATSVILHKYGRIRIQFGEAMSARQILADHGALLPADQRDKKQFERAVKVCGYLILGGINAAAVITPTSITAAVLLTKIQRGIRRSDLLTRVGYLLDVASRRGAVLSGPLTTAIRVRRQQLREAESHDLARHAKSGGVPDPLGAQSERARLMGEAVAEVVDKVLAMFEAAKWIRRNRFEDEDVFIVKKAGRLHLDYYKNNMIHLFVPDALTAAAILALQEQGPTMTPDELRDMTKFLSRLLKFEFVYAPGVGFEQQYDGTLTDFCRAGWMTTDQNGNLRLTSTVTPVVALYAKLVQNFIESYVLVGRGLAALGKGAMSDREFIDYVQQEGQMAFELGDVQCYEAISKVNLTNALKIFLEQGYVRQGWEGQGKKRQKMLSVQLGEGTGAQLAGYVARIRALHAPWRMDKF